MLSGSFDKAVQHHRAGEFDKAIALYRACLRTAKGAEASRVMQMLAAALQQTGQSEQAEGMLPKFRPGGLHIVRAGGAAGLMSGIIGGWASGERGSVPVTKEVTP